MFDSCALTELLMRLYSKLGPLTRVATDMMAFCGAPVELSVWLNSKAGLEIRATMDMAGLFGRG